MKKFLSLCILLVLIVFFIDTISGFALRYFQNQSTGGDTGRIKYVVHKVNQQVLVFGSSRAHYHYNPDIIADSLKMSCYDCGQNGMGEIYFYAVYKMLLQRYRPQMIIYDIYPPYDLLKNDNSRCLYNLRPYYDIRGVDSVFWDINGAERIKMLSNLYRYNSRLSDFLKEYHGEPKLDNKGFESLSGKLSADFRNKESHDSIYDGLKIYYLEKLIRLCKQHRTQLIFVASPRFEYQRDVVYKGFKAVCKKYHIPFINYYSHNYLSANYRYFANDDHLNNIGATEFSKLISHDIKVLLENR